MPLELEFLRPWLPTLLALGFIIILILFYGRVYRAIAYHIVYTFKFSMLQMFFRAYKRPAFTILMAEATCFAVRHSPVHFFSGHFIHNVLHSFIAFGVFWGLFNLSNATHGFIVWLIESMGLKKEPTLSNILSAFIRIMCFISGLIVIAKIWDYDLTGLIASLGILSLALALAAKDALANVFGSLIIVVERPFKPGDWVSANGTEGIVEKVSFRSTSIRTFTQELVFIPNSILSNTPITNYTMRHKRRLDFTLGLTYDSPRQALEDFMAEVKQYLEAHPYVLTDINNIVQVNFVNYNDSSLDIRIICYINTDNHAHYLEIVTGINLELLDLIAKHGLSCAFPSTSIYMEKK